MIKRDNYLKKLIAKKENGLIKVITGLRRSGKSYLLFTIYKNYLLEQGIKESQIIELSLDDISNLKYRNPFNLDEYIKSKIKNIREKYFIFLDEIQMCSIIKNPYVKGDYVSFVDVLLGLIKRDNVDIYVTGSNSRMLSSEILTQFRGRSDEIRVTPLSFKEFYEAYEGDKHEAFNEYIVYGGMPYLLSLNSREEKIEYLKNLFKETYIKDILERNDIKNNEDVIEELLNVISSSIGSLTNPLKLSNTFKSIKNISISSNTINKYLNMCIDAFIIKKSKRYDIKGKKYIDSPFKYYFEDIGLRNARINFSQIEENHIMENIIYNELLNRGFNVDVGIVEHNYKDENGKSKRKQYEIDFVCNKGNERIYIQSALNVNDKDKKEQEIRGFLKIDDSYKKIVVVRDNIIPLKDENGILFIGIEKFLLDYEYLK